MINYITSPFRWFFKLEAASGLLLLISAIIALIISNSSYSEFYFHILHEYVFIGINNFGLKLSVLHWINDALMAIFFFFVTLEIKREFLQGELSNRKQALLPIIAAIIGSKACFGFDNSPCKNSLLISRVTKKKKIAIKASLIQCNKLNLIPKLLTPTKK